METFASTNRDTKSDFLTIYLNELISLKYRGEKNVGKHLQIVWLHLVCRCTGLN